MPIHILTLKQRVSVAKDTVTLFFSKPDNFSFIPGQYGGFTLINPQESDVSGNTRRFSLLCTPKDDYIAIATRIQKSTYKRSLMALAVGDQIKMAGPTGNFLLHSEPEIPAIMIAGGIGIAPFYSMIKAAEQAKETRKIMLFYGNQTPADSAFLDELAAIEKRYPYFKFIPTMAAADNDWLGERGFVNEIMLREYIDDITAPHYYICGSPAMVSCLQELVAEMGVADEKIHVEDFPGY